jgi:hypothetical protein
MMNYIHKAATFTALILISAMPFTANAAVNEDNEQIVMTLAKDADNELSLIKGHNPRDEE